jgi:arabinose-5-phosphate isomerase
VLDDEFVVAVEKILNMRGCLIVTGIGKAGLIGRKLAATFASTGTRAHFVHPSEALHGDLGAIGPNDILLALSNSGSTEEIVQLLPFVARRAAGLIAITSDGNSPLARAADITLALPRYREACQHNLAPTTSTTAMLAMGDALAMVLSEARGFGVEDFAALHPGGSLGRKLAIVDEVMRPLSECRIAQSETTIRQMLVEVSRPGRRTGAVMLTTNNCVLEGIFTDSDLAKMLEHRRDSDLDLSVGAVMSTSFSAIQTGARLNDAIEIMVQRKISELPVVDMADHPIGMIDITDVLGLEHAAASSAKAKLEQSTRHTDGDFLEADWGDGPTTLRIFGPLR